jgi:demethylmenaquinone methyltransferase/2-methoxy-6-polyprenyl-1,4-benzoquinol methylase
MIERPSQDLTNRGKVVYFGYRPVTEAEKFKLVQRHFDTVAANYDLGNTILSFGLHHYWKRIALKMLGLRPGDWVIDVCGGTGDLAILAARAVDVSGRVFLYDFNRPMMDAGRSKVARASPSQRIIYVQGDAEEISVEDQCLDAAMIGFGIRNLTHMDRGFQEIHRILKPGGKLMCLEFSIPTAPWFRCLYDLYSFSIMPVVGRILVGSWAAYTYLPESIRMFPLPEELTATLHEIGFAKVIRKKLSNGIAFVYLAIKA